VTALVFKEAKKKEFPKIINALSILDHIQ
jgi:hypothetical protein